MILKGFDSFLALFCLENWLFCCCSLPGRGRYLKKNMKLHQKMSFRKSHLVPKMSTSQVLWVGLLCLLLMGSGLLPVDLQAQGQMTRFSEFTETRGVLVTSDGGFLLGGRIGNPLVSGQDDGYMAKVDPDGTIQWQQSYGGTDAEDIVSLAPTSTGQFAFTGYTNSFDINGDASDVFVGLVDLQGKQKWLRSIGGMESDRGNAVIGTSDGGVVVTGCYDCFGQPDLYLARLDTDGNELWAYHNYNPGYTAEGFAVVQTQDGGFAITGALDQGNGTLVFLLKTDADGQEEWQQVFGGLEDDAGYGISEAANGDLLVTGITFSSSIDSEDLYLLRTTADGQYIWHNTFGAATLGDFGYAVQELPNGEIAVAGSTWSYGAGNGDVYLIKTNADGDAIWSRTYGTLNEETGRSLQLTPEGGFMIAGINRSFDGMGMITGSTGLVVEADQFGLINDNKVQGKVFQDLNGDCLFQIGEPVLENWLVGLEGGARQYTTTDADGFYEFVVGAGQYELNFIPSTYNWDLCLSNLPTINVSSGDTLTIDLPVEEIVGGPYLEVDVSTSGISPCAPALYHVSYCNKGPVEAPETQVDLKLDDFFTYLSSSVAGATQDGRNYTFALGTLNPWQCGSFTVEVAVDCDALPGLTHCIEAHISPDSIYLPPDPTWDGSSLEVEGSCKGDTVVFTLRNVGTGPMLEAQNYIVIEDDLVFLTGPIQLAVGAETQIKEVADGKTYRLEVNQVAGHPGKSRPSVSVEACGEDGMGGVSLGFVTQFCEDDDDFFKSIDCQENTNAFASFEKKTYPQGTHNEHFIEANTDLEYHIRFENNLMDTAHRVVIRDTLSSFLDVTTVRPGASSHPYEFELYDHGIVKFTFSGIDLPPGSEAAGFVKFRVSQLADNPPGTVIRNTSAIYLDVYPPQHSPEVFHTIKEPVVYAAATDQVCQGEPYEGVVYDTITYFYDTLQLVGYDSITITQLQINPVFEASIDTSICEGDELRIGPFVFTEAGSHRASFSNQYGCDSTYLIELELLESPEESLYEEICEGDSLLLGGNIYTAEGKYIIIQPAANGCDSSVHLSLNVLETVFTEVDTTLGPGSYYNNVLIKTDTAFQEVYTAANGCDSIVKVMVTVLLTGQSNPFLTDEQVQFYPNPTRGEFNLKLELPSATHLEVRLYVPVGKLSRKLMPRQVVSAGQHQLRFSIADLPSGTYLLWLGTDRSTLIRKVIKWD